MYAWHHLWKDGSTRCLLHNLSQRVQCNLVLWRTRQFSYCLFRATCHDLNRCLLQYRCTRLFIIIHLADLEIVIPIFLSSSLYSFCVPVHCFTAVIDRKYLYLSLVVALHFFRKKLYKIFYSGWNISPQACFQ